MGGGKGGSYQHSLTRQHIHGVAHIHVVPQSISTTVMSAKMHTCAWMYNACILGEFGRGVLHTNTQNLVCGALNMS